MIERTTSTDLVVAGALWATVALLYVAAGILVLAGHPYKGILVAEIACGVSAYAAVRTIRCYAVRMCELVRRLDDRIAGREREIPLQRIH